MKAVCIRLHLYILWLANYCYLSDSRLKKSVECGQSLKKILNGGGSLSTQLIEDATKCFPRAKLFSAYGILSFLHSF